MENLQQIIQLDILNKIIYGFYWLLALLWIWGILWVTKDITNRTDNIFLEILSILLVTFLGPIWLLYYFIIRPTWYKRDRNWRREAIISTTIQCPNCWTFNDKENNYCVECWENLKTECKECKTKYSLDYNFCPNCGAPNID